MKKINLILIGGALSTLMITQSCQQPEADQATIDAKVTEMYNAEKMKVENESATACEDAINAQVKTIQDSMASLSAKQQADLLAKKQRDLKAAQLKADAAKKKALADAKKKAATPAKPKTADDKLKDRFNKTSDQVQKEAEKNATDKLNDRFNKTSDQVQKEAEKKADEKLKSRF
jgi:hypothetical protein